MDSLAYKHFASAAEFGKAMELLYQYEKLVAEKLDWRELEDSMLSFLEDSEAKLLERVQRFVAEQAEPPQGTMRPTETPAVSGSSRVDTTSLKREETVSELVDKFIIHKRTSTKLSSVKSYEEKCRRFDRIATLLNGGRSPTVSKCLTRN